jgi:tetratricopeptide (TPR) repeat protein
MSEPQQAVSIKDPFPGPRPFRTDEGFLFQGREQESADLLDLALSYQAVVFYSKSGSGKSSLVNAALIPALEAEDFDVLPVARVGGKLPPYIDGTAVLNIFVFNLLSSCFSSVERPSVPVTAKLDTYFATSENKPRLLIIDQFEELFASFPERWRERKPFFDQLGELCEKYKDLHILLVIREDHLAELDPYACSLPNGLRIRYRLERLGENAALQAITVPLNLAGFSFDKGVAENLASNLRRIRIETDSGMQELAGEYIEPMHLQLVCSNLWSNLPKDKSIITASDVAKFGNVDEALKLFYERAVGLASGQPKVREGQIRLWVEKKLITPGGTRALVYMGRTHTEGLPNKAVQLLEGEHLLHAEWRGGTPWYELTHDRLLAPVKASNRPWSAKRRLWKSIAVGILITLIAAVALSAAALWYKRQQTARTRAKLDDAVASLVAGNLATNERDWDGALKEYQSALSIYNGLGVPDRQADLHTKIGLVYAQQYKWDSAIAQYKQALVLHESLADQEAVANDEVRIAQASVGINYQDAIQYWSQAAGHFQKLNMLEEEADAIRDMGDEYRVIDDYKKAETSLLQSLGLYRKLALPKPQKEALAKIDLAMVYGTLGEYQRATQILRQALPDLSPESRPFAILNLGVFEFYEGNLGEAFKQYQDALGMYKQNESVVGQLDAQIHIAQWYETRGECTEGSNLAEAAQKKALELNETNFLIRAKRVKARSYLCAHQLQKAALEANETLNLSIKLKDRWEEAYSLYTLALVAEAQGNLKDAIANGEKAIGIYHDLGSQSVDAKKLRSNLARWQRIANGLDSKAPKQARSPAD